MNTSKRWVGYGILLVVVVTGIVMLQKAPSSNVDGQTVHVRWLLSHQPSEVFMRATKVFADELSAKTSGRLVLDVVTPEDVGYPSNGDIPNADVMKFLHDGRVELATTYTAALGKTDPAMWGVILPFLFKDYPAANAALDGAGGQAVLDTVASTTDTHALAYTMSGGFRIIASKTPIKTPADLKGKRIATSAGPVAEATLSALGAIPVATDLESAKRNIDANTVDGVETAYSRLSLVLGTSSVFTKNIAETYHSMFLTVTLVRNSFYDTLSPADQEILRQGAVDGARAEREDSIALGYQTKEALQKSGTQVYVFTTDQRNEMKTATQGVYTQFESQYGSQWAKGLTQ